MTVSSVAAVQARIAEIQQRFATEPRADLAARFTAHMASDAGTPSWHATAMAAPAGGPAPDWAASLPAGGQDWAPAITAAAERHGVDPRLLASLVWTESDFQPDAVSSAGAIGLTQLMPSTAAGLGVDPHDPVANLDGGARYLREQLDRFGRTDLALAAYNAGPGRVAQAGGIPQITETQAYVRRVLDHYGTLT